MGSKKLLAVPTYDDEIEKWIIEVQVDGEFIPVGRTTNKELGIFKVCEYNSREDAIEWLNKHSHRFVY